MLSLLVTALAGAADFAPLELNNFVEAHLTGSSAFYRVWLSSSQSDVKVHLLPLSGDADLLVSFDPNATFGSGGSHTVASWSLQSQGVEELLLRRQQDEEDQTMATSYQLGVVDAADAHTGAACHHGCTDAMLSNRQCDPACNVTACAFDRGKCIAQLASACRPGCEPEWLHDGQCDDACFNDECGWDQGDCESIDIEGCANSCFADYIDDGECDKACNTPECLWDGKDCEHGHPECYEQPLGEDYRGAVNVTVSGRPCQ
jgi:hypothetical protein